MINQNTIAERITINGIGLHSGVNVALTIHPADANTGIVFVRTDITDTDNRIPAQWNNVVDTRMCTVIANKDGASVGTIEHIMAALRACGIDNCEIHVNAAEIPIMDGSSYEFVDAIHQVGIREQDAPRVYIRILKDVTCTLGDSVITLSPHQDSVYSADIAFDHESIGQQSYTAIVTDQDFTDHVANARTFGFLKDVEMLQANGLARGGSLDNAIVLNDDGVMNPDGLRHDDEFVRHKVLDFIGDTYLAGHQILGHFKGKKPGHAVNNAILHTVFSGKNNYEYTTQPPTHMVAVTSRLKTKSA